MVQFPPIYRTFAGTCNQSDRSKLPCTLYNALNCNSWWRASLFCVFVLWLVPIAAAYCAMRPNSRLQKSLFQNIFSGSLHTTPLGFILGTVISLSIGTDLSLSTFPNMLCFYPAFFQTTKANSSAAAAEILFCEVIRSGSLQFMVIFCFWILASACSCRLSSLRGRLTTVLPEVGSKSYPLLFPWTIIYQH